MQTFCRVSPDPQTDPLGQEDSFLCSPVTGLLPPWIPSCSPLATWSFLLCPPHPRSKPLLSSFSSPLGCPLQCPLGNKQTPTSSTPFRNSPNLLHEQTILTCCFLGRSSSGEGACSPTSCICHGVRGRFAISPGPQGPSKPAPLSYNPQLFPDV